MISHKVIVIGGGPAGIGCMLSLQRAGIDDILVFTKVFINGTWEGLTTKPYELINKIKQNKWKLILDKSVSCYFHTLRNEIRIYCDGGRIFRPILRVNPENNQLYLTKKE